ncbi:MAG TPA: hypothetical protein VGH98_18970 [Gemmatimonadaceae bacterium]
MRTPSGWRRRPTVAKLDLTLALAMLVLAIGLCVDGALAARAAVAANGYNVDSGVYEQAFAVVVLVPIVAVLLLAARANSTRPWTPRWTGLVLHFAGLLLVGLVAMILVFVAAAPLFRDRQTRPSPPNANVAAD